MCTHDLVLFRRSWPRRRYPSRFDRFCDLRLEDFGQLTVELIESPREHPERRDAALSDFSRDGKRDREGLLLIRRREFLFNPQQQRRRRWKVRPCSGFDVARILIRWRGRENHP